MTTSRRSSRTNRRMLMASIGAVTWWGTSAARGQSCWVYVDSENALAPIECVEQGDGVTACSWDLHPITGCPVQGDCHLDGDLSDCCTSVPASASQTVREMHVAWHTCFGAIGDHCDGDNPPGRGARWYAFHRQMEYDFNRWREAHPELELDSIEAVDWCPNTAEHPMLLLHGFFGAHQGCASDTDCDPDSTCDDGLCYHTCVSDAGCEPGYQCVSNICVHVAGCGEGLNRPNDVACDECQAFPQCLFNDGAGPTDCPDAPSPDCESPAGTYPYDTLDDFASVEEVATVLDDYFHGQMHGAVGHADGGGYCEDANDPDCSVRDPMFWRLHKALDDVVRAWQDVRAVDVVVVIDRSGSMSAAASGGGTRLAAAVDAARFFAELLENGRSDGQTNRIGVVSYSSDASDSARNLALTDVDATLLDPGGPLDTVLSQIETDGPAGCTAIGQALQAAMDELCGGTCKDYVPAAGENERKAVLLLTDGVENIDPCLRSLGTSGSSCSDECYGDQLDFDTLGFIQLCIIGYGEEAAVGADLMQLVAERQGGIYTQDPDGVEDNLQEFFTKCFAKLNDEFMAVDPGGFLGSDQAVSPPVTYTACEGDKITVVSGWKTPITPGNLRLVVTSPSGALVRPSAPGVEGSLRAAWDFLRVRLPFQGDSTGTWRAHLLRPHQSYVNGFTTDSFAVPPIGVAIVRRQIQRLCLDGCNNVLYYEDGRTGPSSVYQDALNAEVAAGVVGTLTQAADAVQLNIRLMSPTQWDLIVYAHQMGPQPEPYDGLLAQKLCAGQRAIITDTRLMNGQGILACADAAYQGTTNRLLLAGDGRLVDGTVALINPGRPIATYALTAGSGGNIQANFPGAPPLGAIVAKTTSGLGQYWFINVLVRGLSKLDPHLRFASPRTGDEMFPTVRILPSFNRRGGYDAVDARVEITRPTIGIGTLLAQAGLGQGQPASGETIGPRAATLRSLPRDPNGHIVPTELLTIPLYDDGTHGDHHASNGYWTAGIGGLSAVDGMYHLRFILDLTANGCTTRRELSQNLYVEVAVDQGSSMIQVGPGKNTPGGGRRYPLDITPRDALGNYWGPGRLGRPTAGPMGRCALDTETLMDHGNGMYSIDVITAPGVASCDLAAFGTAFDIALGLPADFDGDGDVDGVDYAHFRQCFSGPNVAYPSQQPPCAGADTDAEGDVDLFDFARFQVSFTG